MPARMVIEMVHASVFWLSMFPATDGVSDVISPRGLVVGLKLDYNKHCKLEFGSYVQIHEEHDNSMTSRTTGAIALRPTGNTQGGYYFMSLTSGRRLSRNHWTSLPIPQDVIDRVHVLARRSNANRDLSFAWRNGTAIADEEDNSDYEPDTEYDSESDTSTVAPPDDDDDDETVDDDNEEHIVNDIPLPREEVAVNTQTNEEEDTEDEEQDNEEDNPETIAEDNEQQDEDSTKDDDLSKKRQSTKLQEYLVQPQEWRKNKKVTILLKPI
jgi:hypothetical protein